LSAARCVIPRHPRIHAAKKRDARAQARRNDQIGEITLLLRSELE
jgi:hypothetical protein